MRTRVPATFSVIAVLAVAGCGSSSKGGSGTAASSSASNIASTSSTAAAPAGPPLSVAQLRARADAICARLDQQLSTAKNKLRSMADIVRVAPERAALEQAALSKLRKLVPPQSVAGAYEQLLSGRNELAEDTVKLGGDASAGSKQGVFALIASSDDTLRQIGQLAHQVGVEPCGRLGEKFT